MKVRTFYNLALQGATNLRRNQQMSLAASFITLLSMVILGFALIIILNLNYMAGELQHRVEMRVYLLDELSTVQRTYVGERLKQFPEIKAVHYVSRDEALQRLKKDFGNRQDLFAIVSDNPLPDSYELGLKSTKEIAVVADKVSRLPGVEKVNYGKAYVDRLLDFSRVIWILTTVGAVLLAFGTLFIITNAIRLTIYARRREIEIMKLVGATDWLIRLPFIFEGMFIGIGGSAVATLLVDQTYNAIASRAAEYLPFVPLIPRGLAIPDVSIILLTSGLVVGIIGSILSMRRYLHV
jgi:cell division transport system permease protein